ncbi:MAG: SusC/RagA family TonB-linked outer membrane protein [Bacteroidota bacterium]
MRLRSTISFLTSVLFMALCLGNLSAFAQTQKITGKIATKSGQGIAGAVVRVKENNFRTTTDEAGTFTVQADKSSTLVVSSFGFITTEKKIAGDNVTVVLNDDPALLTEVVVTAYGIKKEQKRLGYSVSVVKGSDVNKVRDANPLNALAGKVAGLSVGANAEMLGRPEIVLRGSTDLLFVVDGVPVNTDTWNISPDDIESYTVLKGTNASALYGFRGLNGAIVITTKRGTKDKKGWSVDVNSSNMFQKGFLTVPESQTEYGRGKTFAYDYGNRLYDNAQRLQEYGPRFEGQLVRQYDSPYDLVTGIRTPTPWTARGADNFNKFMETGLVSTNNVALSASGDRYDIRMSVSHMYQKGVAPNTKLNADNFNLSAGYNITSKFKVEANLNLNQQYSPNIPDVNYGPNSYIYMFKVYGSSDYDINDLKDVYKGPQGVPGLMQYAQEYGRENSAWFMAKQWLRSHDKTDIYGYIKASYKFSDALNLSVRSQLTTWNQARTEKVPAGANLNTYTPWYYFGWYGDYHEDKRSLMENNTDLLLNFDKKLSNWTISALAGASERSFKYNSFWGTTKALAIPGLYSLSNSKDAALSYTWGSKMQVYSAFYSMDFTFKNYFTLSHTGRVDKLSTLADGNNAFYYPSVSASTVLTDYLHLPKAVSFIKLRASYANVKGALTQSAVPSAFTQVTGKSTNGGLLGYGSDLYSSYDGPSYANQNAYAITSYYNGTASVDYSSTIANPTLKPFNRQTVEAGLDMKFLKNRIGFDLTFFQSLNGPQIYALPVAPSTSYGAQNVNGITTKKQGFELSINGSPLRSAKGLNWDVNFNIASYKETLDAIYGNESVLSLNSHNYKVGDRLDAYYGAGFVRDGSNNIFYSGGLPLRAPSDINNNTFLGNLNPDFTFGFGNKFTLNNFSLSFQFDGRIGGKIYDEIYKDGMNGGTSIESATGAFGVARLAEWQTTSMGTVAPTPKYVADGLTITGGTPKFANGQITNIKDLTIVPNTTAATVQNFISSGIGNVTEYWMIDRSYVKLREVSFGYTFPAKMLGNNKVIKSASISLVGRNLLYFAARKDFDIDQFTSGFNDSNRSLNKGDALQSVTTRNFGFNLNLTF